MNLLAAAAIFEQFTSNKSTRYDMSEPFIKGGYLWATDSRVCVRYKTSEPDSAPKEKPFPDCTIPFADFAVAAAFVPLEKTWTSMPCWACAETGECACDNCTEVAEMVDLCRCCRGKGAVHFPLETKIGTATVATHYAALISQLRDIRVAMPGEGQENSPISFVFEDGEGLLMPLDVSQK